MPCLIWKARRCARLAGFLLLKREFAQAIRWISLRDVKLGAMLATPTTSERAMPRLNPLIPGNAKRPPPPAGLDERERTIWRQISARLPQDWSSQPLMKELCRHIRNADDLADELGRARDAINELRKTPEPPTKLLAAAMREYRVLLRAHGAQSQAISALSTRLRLTPQSRYQPSTAQTRATETPEGIRPWNDWGNNRSQ
jgi:hypothetical protein